MQQRDRLRGRTVGVVITGGNVDSDVFAGVLSGRGEGSLKQPA